MSYNKSAINLDNCDLYEYVMEQDQRDKSLEDTKEHLYVPKIEKIRKDNSMNVILIVAIVLALLGIYCYLNRQNNSQTQSPNYTQNFVQLDPLSSYYF